MSNSCTHTSCRQSTKVTKQTTIFKKDSARTYYKHIPRDMIDERRISH